MPSKNKCKIGGLERSAPQRTNERGEADSRAEPHIQEPLQYLQIYADWRFGAQRQEKDWLLR